MSNEDVLFSHQGQIGFITLNRPNALHALTLPMILQIQNKLSLWKDNEEVSVIILQSSPAKAFCAGGDVRELYQQRQEATKKEFFWHEYRLNYFIHQLGKPYITLMDGATMGGGVGIGMHGSHPVATERFLFAMPETSIGFFPDIGASYLLNQCPGMLGVYLGLTGDRLGHLDALEAGLVKHVISSDRIPEIIQNLRSMDLSQDTFNQVDDCLSHFSMMLSTSEECQIQPEINYCFARDSVEEILSGLDDMNTPLTVDISKSLKQKSPLSLKVTLRQLQRTQGLDLAQCLKMDYDLVGHFLKSDDFYEGVRALLIDKDKQALWNPNSLDEVNEAMVNAYFEPSHDKLVLDVSA